MRSYLRRGGMRCSSRGKPYYRQGGYCFRHTSSRLSPSAAFLRLRRAWVLSRMPQVRSFTVGVLRSCRRQGIDGRLLMAVMAVESNFDIGARPQAKIDRKVSHLRRCLQQTFHSSDAPSSALGMSAVLTHYGMRHRARAQVWRLYSGMCGQK